MKNIYTGKTTEDANKAIRNATFIHSSTRNPTIPLKRFHYNCGEIKVIVTDLMPKGRAMKLHSMLDEEPYLAVSSHDVYKFIFMGEINKQTLDNACQFAQERIYEEIDKIFEKYKLKEDTGVICITNKEQSG